MARRPQSLAWFVSNAELSSSGSSMCVVGRRRGTPSQRMESIVKRKFPGASCPFVVTWARQPAHRLVARASRSAAPRRG